MGGKRYTAKRAGLTSPEGNDVLRRRDLSSHCQTPQIKRYEQGSSMKTTSATYILPIGRLSFVVRKVQKTYC